MSTKRLLSDLQCDEIRKKIKTDTITQLSKSYGVSRATINKICKKNPDENYNLSEFANVKNTVRKPLVELTIGNKLQVLSKLEKKSRSEVAKEYGVSITTIRNIYKNKDEILKKSDILKENSCDLSISRRFLDNKSNELDEKMYLWFLQQRSVGSIISGKLLQEKAKLINKLINGPENFKASNGWLHRFQERHHIHQVTVQGEKLSADESGSGEFIEKFNNFIAEEKIPLDQIYNADESGIYRKILPKKTLVGESEGSSAPGFKGSKERVSALFCANATGKKKVPLLVIGKAAKPRCFKNVIVKNLPAYYKGQKNAWMNKPIFTYWFKEIFIPFVKEAHPNTEGSPRNVILLLDNCSAHPPASELNTIDKTVQVRY